MKKSDVMFRIAIYTIIIILVGMIGFLLYYYLIDDTILGSNGIPVNQIEENNVTTNTTTNNTITNNTIDGNGLTPIEPIINTITNNTTQTEGLTATYYYSQLDDNAKNIYNGLKQNKDKLKTGNYKVNYGNQFNTLLHSEKGEEKLNTAFQSAWNAFSYDNVDLFYLDVSKMALTTEYTNIGGITNYKVFIESNHGGNYLKDNFANEQMVTNAQKELEDFKQSIVQATANDTTYDKVKNLHNWLVKNLTYDASGQNTGNIYGALKEGKVVCEGYARAFKYLLDGMNIPCVMVSGTATNSEGITESHAWNYVQLNEKWYAIDVTWDDPIITGGGQLTNTIKYKYFLKGSQEFLKDHKEDGQISEKSMKFVFPVLSTTNYQ